MKKMKLKNLQVKSYVTSLNKEADNTIKGGYSAECFTTLWNMPSFTCGGGGGGASNRMCDSGQKQ